MLIALLIHFYANCPHHNEVWDKGEEVPSKDILSHVSEQEEDPHKATMSYGSEEQDDPNKVTISYGSVA
jgi:hypothetical protein